MKNKILLMFGILILINIGFAFAYTAPAYNNIAQRLCASYTPPLYNNIDSRLSPCITDTCTAPAINNNWNILWRDNCTIAGCDIGTGALNIYGTTGGSVTFTGDCYASNIWRTAPINPSVVGTVINEQWIKIR